MFVCVLGSRVSRLPIAAARRLPIRPTHHLPTDITSLGGGLAHGSVGSGVPLPQVLRIREPAKHSEKLSELRFAYAGDGHTAYLPYPGLIG